MPFLHKFDTKDNNQGKDLTSSEIFSVYYHNIFEYPLTFSELIRWRANNTPKLKVKVIYKNGFYFIEGNENLVYKRSVRERISKRKRKIAEKASFLISSIPSVKMVGITGSLAMNNTEKRGDIDLIIITKMGKLWTSRILVYLILSLFRIPLRIPKSKEQDDKLCLNMWLDESDLEWSHKNRNFYTAHEILQTVPIINKKGTYGRFLSENAWALNYWPNGAEIKLDNKNSYTKHGRSNIIERLAFSLQYIYMKRKITREIVSPTRAIFHPNDLSKYVLDKSFLTTTKHIG